MKKINLFFKGLLIGLGKIIPGVSGSVIAITLGLYEDIIKSLSKVFKKESINFLYPIFLGIFIAILLTSKIILYFLNKYYFITMMFFIGLMSGGIKPIFKEIKDKQSKKNIIIMTIPIILFLVLDILTKNTNIKMEFNYINIFLLGIVEAITSIIPGISGSAIMMMLGVYNNILVMFSSIFYIDKLLIFIIGIIIGVVVASKILNYCLSNHRIESYYCIFSFCIFSIFIIFRNVIENNFNITSLILGSLFTFIGYLITSKTN